MKLNQEQILQYSFNSENTFQTERQSVEKSMWANIIVRLAFYRFTTHAEGKKCLEMDIQKQKELNAHCESLKGMGKQHYRDCS